MPGGNGTGPMGMGSRTGRSAGFCAGNNMPGYAGASGRGGGFGKGFGGGGRCFRSGRFFGGNFFSGRFSSFFNRPRSGFQAAEYPVMDKNAEIEMLKADAADMEKALRETRDRISRLQEDKQD